MKRRELSDFPMPPALCPKCFGLLDGVANLEAAELPEPGDFTICMKCASVLRFDEKMQLMVASLMDIPVAYRMKFAQAVQAVKEIRGIG
jgi:hypothetical protein